jgi:hypothetical protein
LKPKINNLRRRLSKKKVMKFEEGEVDGDEKVIKFRRIMMWRP